MPKLPCKFKFKTEAGRIQALTAQRNLSKHPNWGLRSPRKLIKISEWIHSHKPMGWLRILG